MEFPICLDVHPVCHHYDRVRECGNLDSISQLLSRYGNLVPRTKWGKIVTMMYALCGIPVYILYFKNMGKVGRNQISPRV